MMKQILFMIFLISLAVGQPQASVDHECKSQSAQHQHSIEMDHHAMMEMEEMDCCKTLCQCQISSCSSSASIAMFSAQIPVFELTQEVPIHFNEGRLVQLQDLAYKPPILA
ncbi:hypothetical protein HII17_03885 [Thalassotalea sp. M1531]|uniref:DUF2946 domain-containing protein n=2 Tax=Thalassotalea algicola TaxID=2716224 RepID=A0A7Y0Q755_9GAMM|nr:hypothetical protein [Thalassotalea algicola]